jgi:hypothetical protein
MVLLSIDEQHLSDHRIVVGYDVPGSQSDRLQIKVSLDESPGQIQAQSNQKYDSKDLQPVLRILFQIQSVLSQ